MGASGGFTGALTDLDRLFVEIGTDGLPVGQREVKSRTPGEAAPVGPVPGPVLAHIEMFSMPAGSEWLIVLVLVLIFFGVGRLPDVLKQLGKGVRSFKDAAAGEEEDPPAKKTEKEPKRLPAGDDLDEEPSKSASSTRERQS